MNNILDAKIKAKELVNKSNISGFVTTSDLNNKIAILARKAELKPEQYVCLSTMIQLTYQVKKDKGNDHVIGGKPKSLFKSKLLPLHVVFLLNEIFLIQNRNTIQ